MIKSWRLEGKTRVSGLRVGRRGAGGAAGDKRTMYLYAQGRRLTRRSARGGPTQSVGVQVGGEGIEEQLELLLETSVSLWEKTEKRLEGLDVSTLTESLSKSQNSTSPQISPDLRRLDGKGRGKPGGGGGEVKSRPMYSTVDDTSEFARVESGNSDSDVASLPRHDDVDDDMHPSSPSRMTKMLMGQVMDVPHQDATRRFCNRFLTNSG